MKKRDLKNIDPDGWQHLFESVGFKPYTGKQIYKWIFKKGANSFDEMTDLSKKARHYLDNNYYISKPDCVDQQTDEDETRKFVFRLSDGQVIETVFIPMERGRCTLCISSQVGCVMNCLFCRTASRGFIRHLKWSEIVDQILAVRKMMKNEGEDITNIVFMGMGEPLNNYINVKKAIHIMSDINGMLISRKKITLSTAGIVPKIVKMKEDELGVNLAISLNATTEELRKKIMPQAAKYTIEEVIEAARFYHPPGSRARTTIEYVLIRDLNDSIDDAKRLAAILSRLPSKVNLIPFNPYEGSDYQKPEESVLKEFSKYLYNKGIQVNIRRSRGDGILAACGQLAASCEAAV